jgi:hypothetical protein
MLKTQIVLPLGGNVENVEQVITSLKNAGVKDLTMVQVVYIHGKSGPFYFGILKDQFLIEGLNQFLKNGTDLIYQGQWDNYKLSDNQLLIIKDYRFFKVKEDKSLELIYEGHNDDYAWSGGQLLIVNNNQFFTVRKDKKPELIYEGPYDDYVWSESQLLVRIGKTLYSVEKH